MPTALAQGKSFVRSERILKLITQLEIEQNKNGRLYGKQKRTFFFILEIPM